MSTPKGGFFQHVGIGMVTIGREMGKWKLTEKVHGTQTHLIILNLNVEDWDVPVPKPVIDGPSRDIVRPSRAKT